METPDVQRPLENALNNHKIVSANKFMQKV
jgi:hypothetical protein